MCNHRSGAAHALAAVLKRKPGSDSACPEGAPRHHLLPTRTPSRARALACVGVFGTQYGPICSLRHAESAFQAHSQDGCQLQMPETCPGLELVSIAHELSPWFIVCMLDGLLCFLNVPFCHNSQPCAAIQGSSQRHGTVVREPELDFHHIQQMPPRATTSCNES